jgi:hypothetical protein
MEHSNTCNKQQIQTLRLLKRNIREQIAKRVDINADKKNS